MTAAQIDQVQRVFDAAVVNPVVQHEYRKMYAKSVTGRVGSQYVHDERLVRKADGIADGLIQVSDRDKRLRLQFELLLIGNALTPITDNPDEAAYLKKIRATLEQKGVWLRIGQPYVRDPDDRSRMMLDPRKFDVWLSLGPEGDAIPSKDGSLTREALLGTTVLGAGYYTEVHVGPVQRALKKELARLDAEIEAGLEEHDRLIKRKSDAAPGVAEISDFVGRADLPSRSIWNYPQQLLLRAREEKVGGNVSMIPAFLMAAAVVAARNAQSLSTYADKSAAGAASAVTFLKVVKTVAEVVEIVLTVTGVGGIVVGATRRAVAAGTDVAVEQFIAKQIAKHPEYTKDLVQFVRMPKGTTLGGMKAGQSSGAGTGWHKW